MTNLPQRRALLTGVALLEQAIGLLGRAEEQLEQADLAASRRLEVAAKAMRRRTEARRMHLRIELTILDRLAEERGMAVEEMSERYVQPSLYRGEVRR
jgi:hypothetical protein